MSCSLCGRATTAVELRGGLCQDCRSAETTLTVSVSCPTCGAKAGEPCKLAALVPAGSWHADRWDSARNRKKRS